MQENGEKLTYDLVSELGPAHDRQYLVHAVIDGSVIAEGIGKTKKSAEQKAAFAVLKNLHVEDGE